MNSFRRDKDDDDEGACNLYQNLEKTTLLQETRVFNETPVNPKKCIAILTKILYLINQGEQLVSREATDCFFAMTKLFQSKDIVLRRMVYLGIKELSLIAEDVIIVTSSLTKDMTGKEDMYRAAAIRALCSITDSTMLQAVERYMKQCIVDKNPAVACAALVSSYKLAEKSGEVVKRWANEAHEALNSDNLMVQYHSVGLLFYIRRNDRLAVSKLVNKLSKNTLKSPYALCMLIRISCKLIEEENFNGNEMVDSPMFTFIESCLRHKSEMVIYEAAHALVNLRNVPTRALSPAFSILQLFCSTPKAILRFAAVRTLNNVALTHPSSVTTCNLDLEGLISDPNRSIATLAITTLLKTGVESSVERLMKQISTFVAEISDEFKVVVVQAISALCNKYPRKHAVLMSFLSGLLREEGGLEYKSSIVETIIKIIEENNESKEPGLSYLCEFIEDCEHTSLAVRILHLLGKEGPYTNSPSRYIRYIYNRVILENPIVRAAAVSALAQFGSMCSSLYENIIVLLHRCQMDSDDEVRDRATYYLHILESQKTDLYTNYIINNIDCSVPLLESALNEYLTNSNVEKAFDLTVIPMISNVMEDPDQNIINNKVQRSHTKLSKEGMSTSKLIQISLLQESGPLHKTCLSIQLTENETEYIVKCVKHVFKNQIIFQFDCLNTLPDQLLENVLVEVTAPENFTFKSLKPIEKLAYNDVNSCFVIFDFPENSNECIGNFGAVLKYIVKDCDPTTGEPDSDEGYNDEYMLEDFEIAMSDLIQPKRNNNFLSSWEDAIDSDWFEAEDTFILSEVNTLQEAVNIILTFLGISSANNSDQVEEDAHTHTLYGSGIFKNNKEILLRAKLALSGGVTMQLTVKTKDPDIAELILATIG